MNEKSDNQMSKAIDSLMNFETVKYFNNEEFEMNRYKQGFKDYQKSRKTLRISYMYLSLGENFIDNSGMLAGSLLTAYMVVNELKTVGKKHICYKQHHLLWSCSETIEMSFQVIMFFLEP